MDTCTCIIIISTFLLWNCQKHHYPNRGFRIASSGTLETKEDSVKRKQPNRTFITQVSVTLSIKLSHKFKSVPLVKRWLKLRHKFTQSLLCHSPCSRFIKNAKHLAKLQILFVFFTEYGFVTVHYGNKFLQCYKTVP